MFITFEGPDGSGKTTQIVKLASFLEEKGHPIFTTREPGGTEIGDQIRQILFDHANKAMHPHTEILLFMASRAQHVEEVIRPRLTNGEIVICDRYRDSTLAYQGYGHGVDLALLRQLNAFATRDLKPDLTIFLDINVEEGLRRRAKGGDWNRLDAYQVDFHKRIYAGYRELVRQEPDRWVTVDANRPPLDVQLSLRDVVLRRLEP